MLLQKYILFQREEQFNLRFYISFFRKKIRFTILIVLFLITSNFCKFATYL